jgi:hypothetical protein
MLRALDSATPVVLCPAMNTYMYQHPFTAQHLDKVQKELGYEISGPQGAGMLACGDEGMFCDVPLHNTVPTIAIRVHLCMRQSRAEMS